MPDAPGTGRTGTGRTGAERTRAERTRAERTRAERTEAGRTGAERTRAERTRAERTEAGRTGAERGQGAGTLITIAPAAGPIGHLLRTAMDAEQVGATRLHLPADQPELITAIAALREHTRLILTCAAEVTGVDVITTDFLDAVVAADTDLPRVVAEVAAVVAANPAGVSIHGRGAAALPALLAALAAGGHVWVDAPGQEPDSGPVRSGPTKDHAALVARAAGLARIAGRPPLDRRAARVLLGLA